MTARWRAMPLTLALGGCAGDPVTQETPPASYQLLTSATEWTEVAREADPFVSDPTQAPACVGSGFFVEDDWVEIDTGLCNWVTLEAGGRFQVARQQQLRLVVSHYDLSASEPGEASLRVQFGACEVWQKFVAIPSPAAVYSEELASPCGLEQGGTLLFHLHNHGQNNWQLQELSVLR
jgi:hypothetical protein